MGGFGSGRKPGADCAEDCRAIDIRRWQREGLLRAGCRFTTQWSRNGQEIAAIGVHVETGRLRLVYSYQRHGGEWESLDYPVGLQATPCHYGGVRHWFACPAVGCGRRVAVLYQGGKYFACRHCHQLAYKSQRETPDDRAARRADRIRAKLGWEPGILSPNGWKPKGMHWKTFWRLHAQHRQHSDRALLGIVAKFRLMDARLSGMAAKMA